RPVPQRAGQVLRTLRAGGMRRRPAAMMITFASNAGETASDSRRDGAAVAFQLFRLNASDLYLAGDAYAAIA
ncbi:hypothetical protein, partial [Azohydromonas lata]|uniref:hypothetical protein n=1 Tax=Azohydromonas lata TaxID=45677 RepID=UPI001C3F4E1A